MLQIVKVVQSLNIIWEIDSCGTTLPVLITCFRYIWKVKLFLQFWVTHFNFIDWPITNARLNIPFYVKIVVVYDSSRTEICKFRTRPDIFVWTTVCKACNEIKLPDWFLVFMFSNNFRPFLSTSCVGYNASHILIVWYFNFFCFAMIQWSQAVQNMRH